MFEQLFQGFTQSRQGQSAMQQLGAQGYSPQQAQGLLAAGLPVAAQSMQQQMAAGGGAAPGQLGATNVGGSHYGMNFLAGAVTGLMRGEGVLGSAVDGMQSVVGGHVAEVIASRFGFSRAIAGVVGAIITPLMIDYLWTAFQGGGAGSFGAPQQQQGFGGGVMGGVMGMMGGAMGAGGGGYGYQGAPMNYPPPMAYPQQQGGYYQGYAPPPDYNAQAKFDQEKYYSAQYEQKKDDAQQAEYNPGWNAGYGQQNYDPGYQDPNAYGGGGWDGKKDKDGW